MEGQKTKIEPGLILTSQRSSFQGVWLCQQWSRHWACGSWRYQVSRMHGQYLWCWTNNDMGPILHEVQAGEYHKWKDTPSYLQEVLGSVELPGGESVLKHNSGNQLTDSPNGSTPEQDEDSTTCCMQQVMLRISTHSVTPVQHTPRSANPGLGDQVWLYHLPWTRGKSPNLQPSWKGSHKVITWIYKIQRQPGVVMMVVDLKTAAVSMGSLEGEEALRREQCHMNWGDRTRSPLFLNTLRLHSLLSSVCH
jgi:hypothetical protein